MATNKDEVKVKFLEVKQVGSVLAFILGNGDRVELDTARCSEAMKLRAMFHGFNQKVRDSAAGQSKEKDYATARSNMQETIDSIYGEEWNRQGGGGSAGIVMEDLANAISQFKNCTFEKAEGVVKKAKPEQRAEWAKNKKIAQLMAEYKAKRLAKEAEAATDEKLEGLDELDVEEENQENHTDEA